MRKNTKLQAGLFPAPVEILDVGSSRQLRWVI